MFNSSENSETIKTEGANWWIASIIVDKNGIDLGDIDTTKKSFLIENDVFTFERQNGNEIFISVSENQTNEERIITFTLQSGNYHDGIRVVQSSN
ncbi:hypothetical protein [Sediminitomix flava]|nr:hypothetical protein [Sediminitomix flava]